MQQHQITGLPSFSPLSFSKESSEDLRNVASSILDGSTSKVELLEYPKNISIDQEEPNKSFTKLEEHIIDHFAKSPYELFIIENIHEDPRFQYDKELNGPMFPVFHVVVPLLNRVKYIIGVIYVFDNLPKKITPQQTKAIFSLANQTASLISFHKELKRTDPPQIKSSFENISWDNYLETSGTALWKLHIKKGELQVNSEFLEILGYNTPEELPLGSLSNFLDLLHPDDRAKFNEELQNWSEDKRGVDTLECKMRHKSGSYIWAHISVSEDSLDKGSAPDLILGELHDITAQKKVWKQIEHVDPLYISIVQAGFNWLTIIDLNGDYTYINTSSGLANGYTPKELIGKNIFSFIHPNEKEKVKMAFSKFLKNETFISAPFRFRHKDGSWKWLEIVMVNLLNDPMIQAVVVNARDITARVSSIQNLKKSEEKHRLLFNSSPMPKYVLDSDNYEILDVNDNMVELYGYSREELLSMSTKELRPKEEVANLVEFLKKIGQQEGTIECGLFIHKKKNGDLMKMDVVAHYIKIGDRNCLLVACNNITEKEKYLEDLKESETKLKKATTIAKLGYWSIDLEDFSMSWSSEVYNIWKRSKDSFDLNYDNFIDTIDPSDRNLFSNDRGLLMSKPEIFDFTHRIITPDGGIKWAHELGQIIKDSHGNPIRLEGTVQDITRQKNEELRLRLVESVATNIKEAVLITEAEPFDGPGPRIIYVNEAFTKMTGYSAEEVIGKTPRILQGPKSDKKELRRLGEAMRRWEPCEITTVNYKKNGDEFWVNFSLSPVADDRGCYTHWISIKRDVTERVNLERQKELVADISRCFNEEKKLSPCLTNGIRHLVSFGNSAFGEILLLDSEGDHLTAIARYPDNAAGHLFYDSYGTLQPVLHGQGLPGAVWEKQGVVVWGEEEIKLGLIRKEAAKTAGIRWVVGVPLTQDQKFLGVLILGFDKVSDSPHIYENLFQELQTQLGAEIGRKLQELELDEIFNCSPDMLVIASTKGYVKKINPAASRLLGYSEKELLNTPFLEFVHPDDRQATENNIAFIQQEQDRSEWKEMQQDYPIHESTNRYITREGAIKWFEWSSTGSLQKGLILAVGRDITEQKKLQNLLQMANNLARIGSWELDMVTDRFYWSDITKEIHEVEKDYEPTVEKYLNFYNTEENRNRLLRLYEGTPNVTDSFDYQMPIITAKGNERWIRLIGKKEYKDNNCVSMYGSVQDIHQLKVTQLAFKNAFKKKNRILESIGDAFIEVDSFGVIRYWNKQAEELLEIDRSNSLGKNLWDLFDSYKKKFELLKKSRTPLNRSQKNTLEVYHPKLKKWLEIITYPSAQGMSVFIKDISERIEAQKNIKESNERFEIATEATNDIIYDRKFSNNKLFFSKGFSSELYNKSQTLQLWKDRIHPEDIKPFLRSLNEALDNPLIKKWKGEYRFLNENGEYVYVSDTCIILRDMQGKALRVIGAMSDISLHKKNEESLKKLNLELKEYITNIDIQNDKLREIAWTQSHIVRAPVAKLMGIIDLLKSDLLDTSEREEMLDHILSSAHEIDKVIMDIVKKSESVGYIK